MRGTDACNEVFVTLLDLVKKRMSEKPMSDMLKKHLLSIFLSAVLYNRQQVMLYLEQHNMTLDLL